MADSLHSVWIRDLLQNMDRFGPEAAAARAYLAQHRTRLSVHDQATGARWTADRRLEIHPRYVASPADHPYAVSLVIHEVRHLQQGPLTALSVYGEMDAWQLQFRFLNETLGHYHAEPRKQEVIQELMRQPLAWDRRVLAHVRELMQNYAGKAYRIDLLPLYPLPREIVFRTLGKSPNASPGSSY
jgi:hypothetical protein